MARLLRYRLVPKNNSRNVSLKTRDYTLIDLNSNNTPTTVSTKEIVYED